MTRNVDQRAEADMERLGIKFDLLSNVPPGSFDRDRSLGNQARMGKPLNKGTVARYVEGLRNGDVFPPVAAQRLDNGLFLILDGNHRLAAHTEVDRTLDVYECDGPDQVLVRYSFEANVKHGLPASEDDRLHHALYLVDNGMSIKEAAQRLQLVYSRLQAASLLVQAGRRADDAQIPRSVWDRVPKAMRAKVNAIRTDEGFAAAVQLIVDASLRADEISRLLTDLAEVRGSASRQILVVKRWRDDLTDQIGQAQAGSSGRRHGITSPRARLRLAITTVSSLGDVEAFTDVPAVERASLAKDVTATIEALEAVRARLEA
jgi:hypothetical protein